MSTYPCNLLGPAHQATPASFQPQRLCSDHAQSSKGSLLSYPLASETPSSTHGTSGSSLQPSPCVTPSPVASRKSLRIQRLRSQSSCMGLVGWGLGVEQAAARGQQQGGSCSVPSSTQLQLRGVVICPAGREPKPAFTFTPPISPLFPPSSCI